MSEQLTLTLYDSKGIKVHQQKVLSTQPCSGARVGIDLGHTLIGAIYLHELRGMDDGAIGAKKTVVKQ
jgi:hypothetical protein